MNWITITLIAIVAISAFVVYHQIKNGPDSTPHDRESIRNIPVTIEADDEYDQDIVGENAYQFRLKMLMDTSGERAYFIAGLEPEPDNPHDKHAVAVTIGGGRVGYIARGQNKAILKWLKEDYGERNCYTCRAVVAGGQSKSYGVWLSIP